MHFPAQKFALNCATPHSENCEDSKRIGAMEPSNNTETEEETVAQKRKRARRVSFADNEITSVHIFRRDDDHSSSSSDAPPDAVLGFFRDLAGDSDDDVDDHPQNPSDDAAGEAADARDSFLKPIGSPSPGGSSTAAATDSDGEF